jgi:hypothetical protein
LINRAKHSPDHVASIALIFQSTSPALKPNWRTVFSVRSVGTPDAFFGQTIQSRPPLDMMRVAAVQVNHKHVGRIFTQAHRRGAAIGVNGDAVPGALELRGARLRLWRIPVNQRDTAHGCF